MKIYSKVNVWDAALDRIRYLFDEFQDVAVGFSGGKDSTVVFQLALKVAKEKNRLPLSVMFIDQEAEWEVVINYIRKIMHMDEVSPLWFQIPIQIFNATSTFSPWLYCWEDGKKWMREKEDISIKSNTYGTARFKKLFDRIVVQQFPNKKTCLLGGVRCEESPQRLVGLTSAATYRAITFGKKIDDSHFIFYPLYDWSYKDIWKAIHDNSYEYCGLYDSMYQRGVPLNNMRVSNLHHETAVHSLFFLQEIEPETWGKLTSRLGGINTAGVLGQKDYFNKNTTLPTAFKDWIEYRDYLLENLIVNDETRGIFRRKFERMDKVYSDINDISVLHKAQIQTILCNDYEFTKLQGFECGKPAVAYRKSKAGKAVDIVRGKSYNSFIKENRP